MTAHPNLMSTASGRQTAAFDYEAKTWGGHEVRKSPLYLGALRLEYCLADLAGIRGRVLEVGCGAGGMARAIKHYRPDLDVYGCDLSLKAIQVARARPAGVTFDRGDAYELPYEFGCFQAVVMFDVLEHLDDPDRAAAEIYRVLEAGGMFHLFVPCEGALYTLHGLLAKVGWRAKEIYGGHIQRITWGELKELLAECGFHVRHVRWSAHLFNQLVDVCYFTGLSIFGRNPAASVEGYLESAKQGSLTGMLSVIKAGVATISFVESKLLSRMPASGVHVACGKQGSGN